MVAYWAAKAFARIATRDFFNTKRHFDYVNLLPSVVIGPDERIAPSGSAKELLHGTRAAAMAPALDSSLNSPFPYVGVPVHVADVAKAHIDAVEKVLVPGNTELILSSDGPEGVVWDRDISEIVKTHFMSELESGTLLMQGSLPTVKLRLDTQKTEETLRWGFTPFRETIKGLIAQYLELKWNDENGGEIAGGCKS